MLAVEDWEIKESQTIGFTKSKNKFYSVDVLFNIESSSSKKCALTD